MYVIDEAKREDGWHVVNKKTRETSAIFASRREARDFVRRLKYPAVEVSIAAA